MNLRSAAVLLVALLTLTGCVRSGSELYKEREKFLDKLTSDGITYRTQLQQQGSQPSEESCLIGYRLRDYKPDEIPAAPDDSSFSDKNRKTWEQQIQEAYLKGCLTGKARPKPEQSGVRAVTPVPVSPLPSG